MELFSTTPTPHRCCLEARATETRLDGAKPLGGRCKEKEFSPPTKENPITNPDEEIDSRNERDSSPSLGGRSTFLPLSIFGRVLLPGDSMEEEVGEPHIPLCIVEDCSWKRK